MCSDIYKRRLVENFDARSRDYNKHGFHGRLVERVLAAARPGTGDIVLDVATGTGLAARSAAHAVGATGKVVGVDLSPGMLVVAARAIAAEGLTNVGLVRADAERLPFAAGTFDLVLCTSAVPYLSDIPTALRHWHALLKPGGKLAFNCWSEQSYVTGALIRLVADRQGVALPVRPEILGTPERCRAALTAAGFVAAEVGVDGFGRFLGEAEIQTGWEDWLNTPLFHPPDPADAARVAGLRAEYLAEARRRATERGLWDEMVAFFVVGRKG